MKKFNKLYAPIERQKESFYSMAKKIDMTVWEFEASMRRLAIDGFISKSQVKKFVTWFRHANNISYSHYALNRNRNKLMYQRVWK